MPTDIFYKPDMVVADLGGLVLIGILLGAWEVERDLT